MTCWFSSSAPVSSGSRSVAPPPARDMVIIAEAEAQIGTATSSRNSEVIHAGIYYPSGSLRARHCAPSRAPALFLLRVPWRAAPEDRKAHRRLSGWRDSDPGEASRPGGKQSKSKVCASSTPQPRCGSSRAPLPRGTPFPRDRDHRQPPLHAGAPRRLEAAGGVLALNTPVERLARTVAGWEVRFAGDEPGVVLVEAVVNCAGHGAQALARATEGYPPERVPPLVLAKGNYFAFTGRPAFGRLVYPAPVPGGLGVHVTLDLAGRMRFGPDVEWVDRNDFHVDPARAAAFYPAISDHWPALPDGTLMPDYAGVRPKLDRSRRASLRFLDRWTGRSRFAGTRPPVRYRNAGPHLLAVAC